MLSFKKILKTILTVNVLTSFSPVLGEFQVAKKQKDGSVEMVTVPVSYNNTQLDKLYVPFKLEQGVIGCAKSALTFMCENSESLRKRAGHTFSDKDEVELDKCLSKWFEVVSYSTKTNISDEEKRDLKDFLISKTLHVESIKFLMVRILCNLDGVDYYRLSHGVCFTLSDLTELVKSFTEIANECVQNGQSFEDSEKLKNFFSRRNPSFESLRVLIT